MWVCVRGGRFGGVGNRLAGREGDIEQVGCQAGGRHRASRMPSWRETRAGSQGAGRGAGRERRPPHSPVMLPVCVPTDLSAPEPSKLCI